MKILGLTWRERRLLDKICYEPKPAMRIIGIISETLTYDHFSFPDDKGFSRDPAPLKSLIKKKLIYERPISRNMAIYGVTHKGHLLIHRINAGWRELCQSKL